MKKKVASIMIYKGNWPKTIEWLNALPNSYELYVLDDIQKGDMLLWTKEYGLQIIIP